MITGIALVTRATDRIGSAIALSLAEQGLDVALHYDGPEDAPNAQSLIAEIAGKGQNAFGLEASLLDASDVMSLVPRARESLGGDVVVLVNNATQFAPDRLTDTTTENFDAHIGANLKAPFVLSKAIADQNLPVLADETGEPTPSGLIVNVIGQCVGKATSQHLTNTLASAGLVALTKSAALDLAPSVRVNAIAMDRSVSEQREAQSQSVDPWLATLPFEAPDPAEVVAALEYFLSAPVVTGQILNVQGQAKGA